jgi:hypothetical protein
MIIAISISGRHTARPARRCTWPVHISASAIAIVTTAIAIATTAIAIATTAIAIATAARLPFPYISYPRSS